MEPVEIRFDSLSQLTLVVEDILPRPPYRGAAGASLVVLVAEIQTPELSGRRRFTVPAGDFSRWLVDMEEFEQRRTGSVVFSDEDTTAFWLSLEATDRSGHLAASIELHWGPVVADFRWERMLILNAMPIDPSVLPEIVSGVRALYEEVGAQHKPTKR